MHRATLRYVLIFAALTLGLAAALLIGLPHAIDWNRYRDRIEAEAVALTGQTMRIDGPIALALWPSPRLTVNAAQLDLDIDLPIGSTLEVARLEVVLAPLPLLLGELRIEALALVRPQLHVAPAIGEGKADAASRLLQGLVIGRHGLSELRIRDGRVSLGRQAGASRQIDDISLDLRPGQDPAILLARGALELGAERLSFTARLGALASEDAPRRSLQLDVASERAARAARWQLDGTLGWDAAGLQLAGRLQAEGDDPAGALAALGALSEATPVVLPAWLREPYRLDGRLALDPARITLDEVRGAIGEAHASGRLVLPLDAAAKGMLALEVERIAPAAGALAPAAILHGLRQLAALTGGNLDLRIAQIAYRDATIREAVLRLRRAGPERAVLELARAVLPGQTTAQLTGEVALGEGFRLDGPLTVVATDLGRLLGWLGLPVTPTRPGVLRSLSLEGPLQLDAQRLRLAEASLRFDATRISGALDLAFAARPEVDLDLTLDRLNLDDYAAALASHAEAWLAPLQALDAEVQARIERLIWRDLNFDQVTLAGGLAAGRIALKRLHARSLGESELRLEGRAEPAQGAFRLSGSLRLGAPGRLLRRLDLTGGLNLARLDAMTLSGSIDGTADAYDLNLDLAQEGGGAHLAGRVGRRDAAPSYALTLAADHRDYADLLRQLGAITLPEGRERALQLALRLVGAADGERQVSGNLALGPTSVTGRWGWTPQQPRPRSEIELSIGEPAAAPLEALAALAGLATGRDAAAGGWSRPFGNWPRTPLPLAWLRRFDGALHLSSKGGLAGPGLELVASLDDGLLFIKQLTAALWDGVLELEASLEARARGLPFWALALTLERVDAARLLDLLGLPAGITGRLDLYSEATTAGAMPFDLVRGLLGDVELELDGRIDSPHLHALLAPAIPGDRPRAKAPGEPPPAAVPGARPQPSGPAKEPQARGLGPPALPLVLDGTLELDRGIARAADEALALTVDDLDGTVAGSLDLLAWIADLELRLPRAAPHAGETLDLQLFGPLDTPDLRAPPPPRPNPHP